MAEVDNKGDAETVAVKEETLAPATESMSNGSDAQADSTEVKAEVKDKAGDAKPKSEPVTPEVKAKIVKQIEYYFGDLNLSKDRFLKEQIQLDDGWVDSSRMLKFNRLRCLSEDWDVIAQALRESSQLMEVSEDGTKVRRSPSNPLPADSKERREEVTSRTIYCNRFPLDTTLDELMAFFDTFGAVENIFMKKDFHKHTFKGSLFVTFKSKEDAEKFLKDEGTKYKDVALEVKQWKTDYFKTKPGQRKDNKRKAEGGDNKSEPAEKKPKDEHKDGVDADDEEQVKQRMTMGAVLHISGMSEETNREEVRELFLQHGDVSWVDFDKGVTEGYIRLKEPNSATATLESLKKLEGGIMLHETKVEVRVVEGEEEVQYWQKMYRDMAERRQKKDGRNKFRGGNNRRGRGGFQGKRGRGGNRGGR